MTRATARQRFEQLLKASLKESQQLEAERVERLYEQYTFGAATVRKFERELRKLKKEREANSARRNLR